MPMSLEGRDLIGRGDKSGLDTKVSGRREAVAGLKLYDDDTAGSRFPSSTCPR